MTSLHIARDSCSCWVCVRRCATGARVATRDAECPSVIDAPDAGGVADDGILSVQREGAAAACIGTPAKNEDARTTESTRLWAWASVTEANTILLRRPDIRPTYPAHRDAWGAQNAAVQPLRVLRISADAESSACGARQLRSAGSSFLYPIAEN
jgi:hypothetical protein